MERTWANGFLNQVNALDSQAITADAVGNAVDVENMRRARAIIHSGTITDGTSYTFKITESDTSGGTYTDVPSGQVHGTAVFAATDDDTVKALDFNFTKKYVKVAVTVVGATTGGVFSSVIVSEPLVVS